jgi:uridylate kinase
MKNKPRILIKLSGEFLAGNASNGLNANTINHIVKDIVTLTRNGFQVGIVTGGGNFFRGISGLEDGINRVEGDYIGMMATVMNAVALKNFFEKNGQKALVMSALHVEKLSIPQYPPKAIEALNNGSVVIFAGGTGNPFFTTDTAGVLRAIEIEADMMLKATRVDGVYSDDPEKNKQAVKYDKLSYDEALQKGLKIMDATAFALARENGLKIIVFDLNKEKAIVDIVLNKKNIGTVIE